VSQSRGFTLIESLITAAIVAGGLVALASIFSVAIRANISNRQMAVATALVYDKMEELKWAPSISSGSDQITQDDKYIRTWQVVAGDPQIVTVTVYAASNPLTHRRTELVQTTLLLSPEF
jgi:prepilin-type N-terminal cleavage/methylation domain-containing protein